MLRRALVVTLFAIAAVTGARAAESVKPIVERTGRWVQQFEQDFITVIADESYGQFISYGRMPSVPPDGPSRRRLQSELLFMRGGDPPEWLAVRNVLSVTDEGRPTLEIPNSRDRLKDAVEGGGGRIALRRLADESSRVNIGVARNFNTPTLPLQFLDDQHRDRFKFKLLGSERVGGPGGEDAWRAAYEERERPTIIKANGRDTDLSGVFWIRKSDGAVLRSQMKLIAWPQGSYNGIITTITVEYMFDQKLQRMVPARMEEQYLERGGDQRIEGTAEYSNYRVFETSGRVVTP